MLSLIRNSKPHEDKTLLDERQELGVDVASPNILLLDIGIYSEIIIAGIMSYETTLIKKKIYKGKKGPTLTG